jgi:hypothetical protein
MLAVRARDGELFMDSGEDVVLNLHEDDLALALALAVRHEGLQRERRAVVLITIDTRLHTVGRSSSSMSSSDTIMVFPEAPLRVPATEAT